MDNKMNTPEYQEYVEYVNRFKGISLIIRKAMEESIKEWSDEMPLPPPTILLGDIGACIFRHFDELENKEEIFSLIEEGMRTPNELIGTAVATGLIEALVNYSCNENPERWEDIEKYLGQHSKYHAEAWMNFDFNNPPA